MKRSIVALVLLVAAVASVPGCIRRAAPQDASLAERSDLRGPLETIEDSAEALADGAQATADDVAAIRDALETWGDFSSRHHCADESTPHIVRAREALDRIGKRNESLAGVGSRLGAAGSELKRQQKIIARTEAANEDCQKRLSQEQEKWKQNLNRAMLAIVVACVVGLIAGGIIWVKFSRGLGVAVFFGSGIGIGACMLIMYYQRYVAVGVGIIAVLFVAAILYILWKARKEIIDALDGDDDDDERKADEAAASAASKATALVLVLAMTLLVGGCATGPKAIEGVHLQTQYLVAPGGSMIVAPPNSLTPVTVVTPGGARSYDAVMLDDGTMWVVIDAQSFSTLYTAAEAAYGKAGRR